MADTDLFWIIGGVVLLFVALILIAPKSCSATGAVGGDGRMNATSEEFFDYTNIGTGSAQIPEALYDSIWPTKINGGRCLDTQSSIIPQGPQPITRVAKCYDTANGLILDDSLCGGLTKPTKLSETISPPPIKCPVPVWTVTDWVREGQNPSLTIHKCDNAATCNYVGDPIVLPAPTSTGSETPWGGYVSPTTFPTIDWTGGQ